MRCDRCGNRKLDRDPRRATLRAAMSRLLPRARRSMQISLSGVSDTFSVPVSPEGFSLELPRCPRQGEKVAGFVSLDHERFAFQGEVAWSQPMDPRASVRGRMTVRFTRIPDAFFERVRA